VQTANTTTRPLDRPGHRVPDLCDHHWLNQDLSLHAILHLPPAHHETSKHDSLNEQKIKVKQLNYPGFKFKPHQVNDSLQSNQEIDHLVSQSPLDESIDNKDTKFEV
jgi:hypothetical protein